MRDEQSHIKVKRKNRKNKTKRRERKKKERKKERLAKAVIEVKKFASLCSNSKCIYFDGKSKVLARCQLETKDIFLFLG